MNWLQLFPISLALSHLSFLGLTLSFVVVYITPAARWLLLIVLAVILAVSNKKSQSIFRSPILLPLLFYLLWCIMTIVWSEFFTLSFMKVVALLLVTIVMIKAGQEWVFVNPNEHAMDYMLVLAVPSIIAGIFGFDHPINRIPVEGNVGFLYSGLAFSPNMFGSLMAMSSPFLLWRLYIGWDKLYIRLLWGLLLITDLVFLLLSASRSSILMTMCIFSGFFLAQSLSRWVPLLMLSLVLSSFVYTIIPELGEQIAHRYIYKFATEEEGVFNSRRQPWDESYMGAVAGGLIGVGYGVSAGSDASLDLDGLTAVGYGREKGNAQLAIIEETGLMGMAFYLVFLITLFRSLLNTYKRCCNNECRVMLGILSGTLVGMLIMSIFEAWWVAPGSVESVYFWTFVGLGVGLNQLSLQSQDKQPE